MVSIGAIERDVLTGSEVRVPVVLVARGAEPGSAKCAFGHYLLPPRRLAISIGNTGYPDKIPSRAKSNPISALFPCCVRRGRRPPPWFRLVTREPSGATDRAPRGCRAA